MCVFGPARVWVFLWLPRLKAAVVKPIHYASLYTEKGLFSLCVEGGKHLRCRLCESSHKTLVVLTLIFKSRGVAILELFFSCFISCLSPDSLFISQNVLPSSVFAFFLLWCVFLFCWTHCWSLHVELLQRALPHHGNSKLSGWLHHVTKCFMSHYELSLFPCFSPLLQDVHTACFVTLNKDKKERTKGRKKDSGIKVWWFMDRKNKDCIMTLPSGSLMKNNTSLSDKWLHRGAKLHCCCKQIRVCVMPRAGRCQTSLWRWNAGLFADTGPSVIGCLSQSH